MNSQEHNTNRIDGLIRYILYVASQQDEWKERNLGPIHIIKYVYLADLAYATYNNGKTYTGINWKFYHYGPWNYPLFEQIPAALNVPYVNQESFVSSFDKDYTRWSIKPTCGHPDLDTLKGTIPLVIEGQLQKHIRQYSNQTYELLHYVYKTKPMLQAAPDEFLNFSIAVKKHLEAFEKVEQPDLTKRQQKKRKERVDDYRQKIQARLKQKKKKLIFPKPNYDEVFEQGVEWIEALAGDEIEPTTGTLHFSNDIWKSEARRDPDDV